MISSVVLIAIFKLGGFGQPFIGAEPEACQDRELMFCDVPALVGVDDPSGVIHQLQVVVETEQNAPLWLIPDSPLETQ